MRLDTDFNPPFENLYKHVCGATAIKSGERVSLLNNLKRHIKREYININYYKEYFKTIFFVLENNGSAFEQDSFSCCYSTLCYLIKRLSMQQQNLLIYNEINHNLIIKSLNFLFEKSKTDNNTKKAILSIYLLQSETFFQILPRLKYQINIIDFIFMDILKLYAGNKDLLEKEFAKYSDVFKFYSQENEQVKLIISKNAKELNIETNQRILSSGVTTKAESPLLSFISAFKPNRQLQFQAVDEQRQCNNLDYFYRQFSASYPQNIFDGKETEENWQKRQQYLTKLLQLFRSYKSEARISAQHMLNAIVCLRSLRTSVATISILFITTLLEETHLTNQEWKSETIHLRIMTEIHHLLQSGKKVLIAHTHYLFIISIFSYISQKYSMPRLGKLLLNVASDKNVTCVKSCSDYTTLVLLCVDINQTNNSNNLSFTGYGNVTPLSGNNNIPWFIKCFKSLNASQFSDVRLRNRQNFWKYLVIEKKLAICSYLDDLELRKLSLGYENKFKVLMDTPKTEERRNEVVVGSKRKQGDAFVDISDLEEYELEIPNLEMTMIPYKTQKLNNHENKENIESRISSGETFAEMEAIEELEMELQGFQNGLTRIHNFDNTGIIEKINSYFAKNSYYFNSTVIQLEDIIIESITQDELFLTTFLNTSVNLSFKLGTLLKFESNQQSIVVKTFLKSIRDSIFQENFTSVMIYMKCCRKFHCEIIPLGDIEKQMLSRFG